MKCSSCQTSMVRQEGASKIMYTCPSCFNSIKLEIRNNNNIDIIKDIIKELTFREPIISKYFKQPRKYELRELPYDRA
jgi:hypothetical protein